MDFAIKGYEVNAFRFITKMEMEKKLPEALHVINKRECEKHPVDYYVIENAVDCRRLQYKDIIKVVKEEKNSIFYTKKGTFKERCPLAKVSAHLPKEIFVKIDQGTILNMVNIERVNKNMVYLENGDMFVCSRSNTRKVKDAVSNYWRNQW